MISEFVKNIENGDKIIYTKCTPVHFNWYECQDVIMKLFKGGNVDLDFHQIQ